MKQTDPLTPAEIAVFGADARRRPDGSIEERGIKWSGSSPEAVAAAQPEQWPPHLQPVPPAASVPRIVTAPADEAASAPPAAPTPGRTVFIHDWPERAQ